MSYINYASNMSTKKAERIKKYFTHDEDQYLRQLIAQYGDNNWPIVAYYMPGRTPRQCRERYIGYLSPNLKNTPWTPEEDLLLLQKLQELGPKWMKMVPFFEGRSDSNIKNRWYKHLKKTASPLFIEQINNKSTQQNLHFSSTQQTETTSPQDGIVQIASKSLNIVSDDLIPEQQHFEEATNPDFFDIFNALFVDDLTF